MTHKKLEEMQSHEKVDISYLHEGLEPKKKGYEEAKRQIDLLTDEMINMLPKYAQTAYKYLASHFEAMASPFDPKGAIYQLGTSEGVERVKKIVSDEIEGTSQKQLIQHIFNQTGIKLIQQQIIESQRNELEILRPYFLSTLSEHYQTTYNRLSQKHKVYAQNNKALRDCYDEFTNRLGRSVLRSDYLGYWKHLVKKYPTPPFVPKPRLTNDEQMGSLEMKAADRASKARTKDKPWSDAMVRKAFKKFSGLKPTTLKK